MGTFGWHNPWPFEWGGGPTDDEKIYGAMRSAVGDMAARSEDGIDGLWRACRAGMFASASAACERAALQAFPGVATDHLPLWELFLGITPSAETTDEERRVDVLSAYTRDLRADGPSLTTQLREIDPRFSLIEIPEDSAITIHPGKAFEPQDGAPDYGPRAATMWPLYSCRFRVPVLFDLPNLLPTQQEDITILRAKRALSEALPAWCEFEIMTSTWFVTDLSPLDITGAST